MIIWRWPLLLSLGPERHSSSSTRILCHCTTPSLSDIRSLLPYCSHHSHSVTHLIIENCFTMIMRTASALSEPRLSASSAKLLERFCGLPNSSHRSWVQC